MDNGLVSELLLYNRLQDDLMFLGNNAVVRMNIALYRLKDHNQREYYYGEPNSHTSWQTPRGEWYERWYDNDGTPLMDRHWTDHQNPKTHPWVPHDEDWKDNGKGGKTIDPKSMRPSPSDAKKPTETTDDITIEFSIRASDVQTALVYLLVLGVFVLSGGMTPVASFS